MEGAGAPGTSVGRSTHYNPDRSGPSPFPEETKIEKSFLTATNHAVVNECRSTALVAGHCYRVAVVFSELVTDTFPVFVLAMFPGLSHTHFLRPLCLSVGRAMCREMLALSVTTPRIVSPFAFHMSAKGFIPHLLGRCRVTIPSGIWVWNSWGMS